MGCTSCRVLAFNVETAIPPAGIPTGSVSTVGTSQAVASPASLFALLLKGFFSDGISAAPAKLSSPEGLDAPDPDGTSAKKPDTKSDGAIAILASTFPATRSPLAIQRKLVDAAGSGQNDRLPKNENGISVDRTLVAVVPIPLPLPLPISREVADTVMTSVSSKPLSQGATVPDPATVPAATLAREPMCAPP